MLDVAQAVRSNGPDLTGERLTRLRVLLFMRG
jgi:hypothetical protein